jgi:hypothetical protein
MTVTVKVGKKEGFVSSYNLFFPDGLRLKTDDLTFMGADDRKKIREQFEAVLEALCVAGFDVEGVNLV